MSRDVIIARAHHGSVSRQERTEIEEALKAGRLPAVVATSSLELGIDMGAVDLVIQVESPPSVASGLQRVGRAGHNVGDISRGVIFPKYAADLVQAAVVADRMQAGAIEELRVPRNPLDVLAQQVVAMTALDDWAVDDLEAVVRRSAPFATLTRAVLEAVLDMLAGRYPGEEFAGLKPRIVWDRVAGVIHGRPGAQKLAVTSGGTIPDRGYFGVFLPAAQESAQGAAAGRRARRGDGVRVAGRRRVRARRLVVADRGHHARPGARAARARPAGQAAVLARRHAGAARRARQGDRREAALARRDGGRTRPSRRSTASGLDPLAAGNLVSYLDDQRQATGHVPDDRTLVVERFRDELGDWRVVLHSPYGDRVHAPWALAITARLRERYGGMDVQALHTDDGIIIRVPDSDEPPPAGIALLDPEEIGDIITAEVGGSALFASRFRECAARALLLPRRQPGRRTPLWQQRQRSAQLLEIAAQFPGFPITLETVRECLQDVFDVPALTEVLRDLAARRIRLVEVETATPSPFGQNLLFRYVGAFMYEGDAPLAERRAQALALDPALLAELLGTEGLRELLDPAVVAETEADLQHLSAARQCRDAEAVADLLRTSGPLTADEVAARCADGPASAGWLDGLAAARRAIEVRVAGQPMWAAIEDAGRLRDALGVALPVGIPEAFTEPLPDPLGDLVARWARTHGPFTAADLAARYGLGVAVVAMALRRLAADGRVAEGEFLAGARGTQWCDSGVLRMLRRRCLARLRKEAEPVPPAVLGRFLPAWHGIGTGRSRRADAGAVLEAIERLAGAPVPASALETLVLPGRVPGYSPALLDELTSAGEVVWAGAGTVGSGDGWLVLAPAESAPLLLPEPGELTMTPLHGAVLTALAGGGGMFFRMLSDRVAAVLDGHPADDADLVAALWDLAWAGLVTNDTLAPLRVVTSGGAAVRRPAAPRRATAAGPGWAAELGDRGTDAGRRAWRRGSGSGGGGRGYGGSGGGRAGPGGCGSGGTRGGGPLPACSIPGRPRAAAGSPAGTGGVAAATGARPRRAAMPTRTGPPTVSGRWSLLPERYGLPDADGPGRTACRRPRRRHRPGRGHHAGARARADPARAARRGHQGRGRRRADTRRVRRRVPGAAGHGGDRPVPPRLLRRGARRRPVRAARRGRPDARARRATWWRRRPRRSPAPAPDCRAALAPASPPARLACPGPGGARRRTSPGGRWCSPRPTRRSPTARRCRGRPGPRRPRPRTGPAARRARSWCCSAANSCCTSSAAARRCCPGPTTRPRSSRAPRPWPRPCATARSAGSRSRRPTAAWSSYDSPLTRALESAGFRHTPAACACAADAQGPGSRRHWRRFTSSWQARVCTRARGRAGRESGSPWPRRTPGGALCIAGDHDQLSSHSWRPLCGPIRGFCLVRRLCKDARRD